MTAILDLSNDWRLICNPVTVTYYVKTGEGTYATGASVTYAQRNLININDVQLGAVSDPPLLQQDMMIFHLWKAKLVTIVPKIGDKLTDGATTWIVKVVDGCDYDTSVERYRLTVIRTTNYT